MLVIVVWGLGICAFFQIKSLVKKKSIERHNEIFGEYWSQHSMHTTFNFLKLVFFPKNWAEFSSRKFLFWVIVSYVCSVLAVCIVFYPIVRMFFLFFIQ